MIGLFDLDLDSAVHEPQTSPQATRAEVIDKIIHFRQNYHFGPRRIHWVHQLAEYDHELGISYQTKNYTT